MPGPKEAPKGGKKPEPPKDVLAAAMGPDDELARELFGDAGPPHVDPVKRARDKGTVATALAAAGLDRLPPSLTGSPAAGSPTIDAALARIRPTPAPAGAKPPLFSRGIAPSGAALGIEPPQPSGEGDIRLAERDKKPPAAPAPKVVEEQKGPPKKIDFAKKWPRGEDLKARLLTDSGGFVANRDYTVTGLGINLRNDKGTPIGRLNRGDVVKITDPFQRFPHPDDPSQKFIRVKFRGKEGFMAENYLPLQERIEAVAERKERLEVGDDEKTSREVVNFNLDELFGRGKNPQKDALYAKWDAAYQREIVKKGLMGAARDARVQEIYKGLFGVNRDIHEDRVRMEMTLSIGAKNPGREIQNTEPAVEGPKFAAFLDQLGYEIGTYYGVGRMTGEEIVRAFDLKSSQPFYTGKDGQPVFWGEEPGCRVQFNYADGKLYFYPPQRKAEQERVVASDVDIARIVARGEKVPVGISTTIMREKPMERGEVTPREESLVAKRKSRKDQYLALVRARGISA